MTSLSWSGSSTSDLGVVLLDKPRCRRPSMRWGLIRSPGKKPPGPPLIFSKVGKYGKHGFGRMVSASMPDSIHVSRSVEGRALYEGLDAPVREGCNEGNGAKMGKHVRSCEDRGESVDQPGWQHGTSSSLGTYQHEALVGNNKLNH